MESDGVTGDVGTKGGEAEAAGSSNEETLETLSGFGGADQLVGYIICFANAVKLYQKKTEIASDVAVLTILWKIAQRISARPPEKQD